MELKRADCRIPESSQTRKGRHNVLEELNLFASELRNIQKKSGKVAAWACEALHPSIRYGIALQVDADGRDCIGLIQYGPDRRWTSGDDDAAFEGNKLTAEFVNPFERAVVIPHIQNNVLTVHISSLA